MRDRNDTRRKAGFAMTLQALALMTLVAGLDHVVATERGDCFTAPVPSGVVLPDGRPLLAIEARICFRGMNTPVEAIFEIGTRNGPTGFFLARVRAAEATAAPYGAFVVLGVLEGGGLVLERLVVARPDGIVLYEFAVAGRLVGNGAGATPTIARMTKR